MRTCEFCGGNADSGCGSTHDMRAHYSKIDCADFLKLQENESPKPKPYTGYKDEGVDLS